MPTRNDRLDALRRQIARLGYREATLTATANRLSNLRLGVVVIGLGLTWVLALSLQFTAAGAAFAVLVVVFAGVVRVHRRVEVARQDHALLRQIKTTHSARVALDWSAMPRPADLPIPSGHPFASDLNLAGPRSVHHLLDTTTTREASRRLLDWLLTTRPDPAALTRRQTLLREIIPLTRFRDRLALVAIRAGQGASARWSGDKLQERLAVQRPAATLRGVLIGLGGLAALNALLLVLYLAGVLPPLWTATFALYAGITIWRRDVVGNLFDDAMTIGDALRRLGAVLGYLERYPYGQHPALAALCAPLADPAARPSVYLRRVSRVAAAASLQGNFFVWLPLNAILPWDVFFAWRLERHKTALREALPRWLDAWYELDALNALATFAYLNPAYPFPELDETPGAVLLAGDALGHPLIPHEQRICNDFQITEQGQIDIITGSNMAGKSSFLRTVGLALVLAYAGSVVPAGALRVSLLRQFTCIQVSDSVIDGISYFYAEVQRLRALLDALDTEADYPLFVLIDEIFRGTNNRERLLGSRAYIRTLVERGATGLIATHDLELVHLGDDNPHVHNLHFRETVTGGQMHFDYRLRPGPCPTTNALRIMAQAGLPVPEEPDA